jgi:FkbM family methyltransferase
MLTNLKLVLLATSRRLHFRGKARLLDVFNLGVGNLQLVPPGIDSVECVEGITISTSRNTDIMFREVFVDGIYQDDVLVALANLLKPGDIFWDIGANYGLMSVYVDRHFDGRVDTVAFEPSPEVLPVLRTNIERNRCSNVAVEPICIADHEGTVAFFTSKDHSWNATMIEQFAESKNETIRIEVPCSTIDECVQRLAPPSVIKLDVEGAEHLVMAGGRRFLGGSGASIVAEYNVESIRDSGLSPEEYLQVFRDLDYKIYLLRRPYFGLHRWESLFEVHDPSDLYPLCNLIALRS